MNVSIVIHTFSENYTFYISVFFPDGKVTVYEQKPFSDRSYVRKVTGVMSQSGMWETVKWDDVSEYFSKHRVVYSNV